MLQRLRTVRSEEKGFTLIELLVVILIIGILAAIALPTFLGQQKKGQDSSAKSDVRNAVSAIESCFADEQNYSLCDTSAELAGKDTPIQPDITVTVAGTAPNQTFTVDKTSKSTNVFRISKLTDGTFERKCGLTSATGTSGKYGCPTGGSW